MAANPPYLLAPGTLSKALEKIKDYVLDLVRASRDPQEFELSLGGLIAYGASPRASQYLVLGAKARAILGGKYHVDFADIRAIAHPVLRHRLVLNFHARADQVDADSLVDRLLKLVPEEG